MLLCVLSTFPPSKDSVPQRKHFPSVAPVTCREISLTKNLALKVFLASAGSHPCTQEKSGTPPYTHTHT